MTLNEYQKKALETAVYPQEYKIIYPALGLTGEAGEFSDMFKKGIRDDACNFTEQKKEQIDKQIGDVMWYCATLANDIGYDLETICEMNYNKLHSRQERGMIHGSGDNR